MKTSRYRVLLPLLLVLPLATGATLARAGGWGVLTVHDLPDYVVAGQPVELSFTVRQHGSTPRVGFTGALLASGAGRDLTAALRPGSGPGVYAASFTLPAAGEWTLTLRGTDAMVNVVNARLLPIEVVAAGDGAAPRSLPLHERGERLFVAKGCVGCHAHGAFAARGYVTVPAGPALSGRRFPDAFLARLLADPQSVPGANGAQRRMPNLELNAQEIDALIAFLNGRG